jgi:hypothetical protein
VVVRVSLVIALVPWAREAQLSLPARAAATAHRPPDVNTLLRFPPVGASVDQT